MQLGAGNSHALVIGDGSALALGNTQAVDGEFGLCSDTFVQVGGAALDVDLGFLGQVRDGLACGKGVLVCDRFVPSKLLIRLPRGCTLRVTGLEAMAEVLVFLWEEAWRLCFCVGARKQRPALKKQWLMAGPRSSEV